MALFDDLFDGVSSSGPSAEEKGLPWRAKEIDGELYLPMKQVIELLKMNDVLPKMQAALERYLKR